MNFLRIGGNSGVGALSPDVSVVSVLALLLSILRRCQTGEARLKGLLPAGTEVAHKTGTAAGINNDVGIITLPNGAGHIAIAVFIESG